MNILVLVRVRKWRDRSKERERESDHEMNEQIKFAAISNFWSCICFNHLVKKCRIDSFWMTDLIQITWYTRSFKFYTICSWSCLVHINSETKIKLISWVTTTKSIWFFFHIEFNNSIKMKANTNLINVQEFFLQIKNNQSIDFISMFFVVLVMFFLL